MNNKIIIIPIVMILLFSIFSGCTDQNDTTNTNSGTVYHDENFIDWARYTSIPNLKTKAEKIFSDLTYYSELTAQSSSHDYLDYAINRMKQDYPTLESHINIYSSEFDTYILSSNCKKVSDCFVSGIENITESLTLLKEGIDYFDSYEGNTFTITDKEEMNQIFSSASIKANSAITIFNECLNTINLNF